jgi:hypothetical protein
MLRQKRLIQLPLFGMIVLCLLVGVYLFTCKRFSKSDSSASIAKHSVETHSDDVLKYWTDDKMHNAKATDLPNVNALEPDKRRPQRPPT